MFDSSTTLHKDKGVTMITQDDIDTIIKDIEDADGNVLFIEEIYKEPEPQVPDFFSILKVLFGFKP